MEDEHVAVVVVAVEAVERAVADFSKQVEIALAGKTEEEQVEVVSLVPLCRDVSRCVASVVSIDRRHAWAEREQVLPRLTALSEQFLEAARSCILHSPFAGVGEDRKELESSINVDDIMATQVSMATSSVAVAKSVVRLLQTLARAGKGSDAQELCEASCDIANALGTAAKREGRMLKYIKIARAHIAEVLHQKQEEARRAAEAARREEEAAAAAAAAAARDTSQQCAICRNPMIDICLSCSTELDVGRECLLVSGACGHTFHNHCMERWLAVRNRCPLDNQDWFERDRYTRMAFEAELEAEDSGDSLSADLLEDLFG